jgi:LDH2 family malate/lactate/ureidoglycolate dehydrogenase
MKIITPQTLEKFLTTVYMLENFSRTDAAICAWHTTLAQKWCVHTHGINLLKWYLASIGQGAINPNPVLKKNEKKPGIALVDADRAHGQIATFRAAEFITDYLKSGHPVSVVGVINSNHFGMAGAATYKIAKEGGIGILMSSTPPIIAAPGAVEKCVGSNPVAIGFPREGADKEPVNFDTSLMVNAMNHINTALAEGRNIPDFSYLDKAGGFTTDPEEIAKFRLAAPLGGMAETSGYKGYGLAFMFELLTAVILGGFTSAELSSWNRDVQGVAAESHTLIGIRPDLFRNMEEIESSLTTLMSFTKTRSTVQDSDQILIPGEDRYQSFKESNQEGGLNLKSWEQDILEELSVKYATDLVIETG